jgi:hypothetical protein
LDGALNGFINAMLLALAATPIFAYLAMDHGHA